MPEATTPPVETIRDAIRRNIGPCREWIDDKHDRCNDPAEYILWGKLFRPEGLGPRCYTCALRYVDSHAALSPSSDYALVNIGTLALDIDQAVNGYPLDSVLATTVVRAFQKREVIDVKAVGRPKATGRVSRITADYFEIKVPWDLLPARCASQTVTFRWHEVDPTSVRAGEGTRDGD
jgi:hypothetical protein